MPLLTPRSLRNLLPLLPAIASLLLLGLVLWANERIVARDLAQRAHYRVAQSATTFADQIGRTLARRNNELLLTGRLITSDTGMSQPLMAEELRQLKNSSAVYQWIGLLDAQGQVHASTDPTTPLPPELSKPPLDAGPLLMDLGPVRGVEPAGPKRAESLGAMLVPLYDEEGRRVGTLVALLSKDYFEAMRQVAMGVAPGRRSLELQLASLRSPRLLGDAVTPEPVVLPPVQATPDTGVHSATDAEGDEWLYARVQIRPVDSPLKTDWTVTARQPLDAARGPADRLQSSLLLWGLPGALLIGGLGMWMSRRIAQPYQQVLDIVSDQVNASVAKAPGAYLSAAADALRRLAPAWRDGDGSQVLLDEVVHDAQRLQQVLEQLPTPVYLLDAQHRVTLWNQQAEAVFGWTKVQALGQAIESLVPGEVHAGAATAPTAQQQHFEARTANHQGAPIYGEWRLLPLNDESGQPQGHIVLMRDISDRVRAAATLAQHEADLSELTQRLMEQEQLTTRRLAQTLHDQLGQTLGAIRLSYDALSSVWQAAETPRHRERATQLGTLIDQSIREVRQALVDLRPPLLEELGLAAALDNEVRMRQAAAEPVELRFEPSSDAEHLIWAPDVAYAAFMIAREALGNALLHAQASRVVIRLESDERSLRLRIEDDGVGFKPSTPGALAGHLGLVGMRERALAIGARLDMQPAQPHGLVVQLTWPASPRVSIR